MNPGTGVAEPSGTAALPATGLLCFDLDGPLLDVRERYWQLHLCAARMTAPHRPASSHAESDRRDLFWRLKQEGAGPAEICEALGEHPDLDRYVRLQDEWIETDRYLDLDVPWPWATATLAAVRPRYAVALITMRRDEGALARQLARTGLAPLADAVVCRAHRPDGPREHKADLVLAAEAALGRKAVAVIGDTDVDVRTARELGLPAVAVACGMCSRERLAGLAPEHIIEDISMLPALCG